MPRQLIYRFGMQIADQVQFVGREIKTSHSSSRVGKQAGAKLAIDYRLTDNAIQLFKTH